MDKSKYQRTGEFPMGYTSLAEYNGKHSDMLMDFGILKLAKGQVFTEEKELECAYLLVEGEVTLQYLGEEHTVSRINCFDASPWVLHIPRDVSVTITGVADCSEIAIQRAENNTKFEAKLYSPAETPDEHRGAGTMNETCTRIVRTVFDKSNAPYSNLVLGEVITTPGKWSSYPPHIHPQPEIYYYKLNPENGYGICEYGDDVIKVFNNDTVFIDPNATHPQSATPGHAMWYLWVIRHLDDDPYQPPQWPHFLPEFDYIRNPETKIWPNK